MSIRRSFDARPSVEATQNQNVRKQTKDNAREAFAKAEANRRDGALSPDFTWEKKPKAHPAPVVENPDQPANPDAMI